MKNSGRGGDNTPNPEKVKDNHVTEVIKLSELLKTALKYMDAEDSDGATEKNGVGFNKDDGKLAREILAKDKWEKEDVRDAFEILKHYKNTQLKDKWKDITWFRSALCRTYFKIDNGFWSCRKGKHCRLNKKNEGYNRGS